MPAHKSSRPQRIYKNHRWKQSDNRAITALCNLKNLVSGFVHRHHMKIIVKPRTDFVATVTLKNNKIPGKVSSQTTSWMCKS